MKRTLTLFAILLAVLVIGIYAFRTPEPDRVTHLTLRQTGTVDIDSGLQAPGEGADLWYRAVTAEEKYLEPRNGATLGLAGRDDLGDAPINLEDLEEGDSLRVRTDMGREAELEVLGFDGNDLMLRVALWGDDLPQDQSGKLPERKERLPLNAERTNFIEANIERIAKDEFPDNSHNTWKIWSTVHDGEFTYVEVKPDPKDVGYPSFKFLLHFEEDTEGESIAVYAMDGDEYSLLSTDPAWDGKVRDRPL